MMLRVAPSSAVTGTSSVGPSAGVLSTNSCTRLLEGPDRGAARLARARARPRAMSTNSSRPASGSRCSASRELAQGRLRGVGPAARAGARRPDGQQAFGRGAVGGQQALFLVLELLVEGRARDAGLGADLRDADRLRAQLRRQADDRVEQALPLRAPLGAAATGAGGLRPAPGSRRAWLNLRSHCPRGAAYKKRRPFAYRPRPPILR